MYRWNKNPILAFISSHIIEYPTPINLNYMWSFGSAAGICLVIQIISGVFLAMFYTPHIKYAFSSVEFIMRDVNNGWIIRYLHSNGASMFFIVVYCHIFRGIYFGSYMKPRAALWVSGILIFLLMMATAFIGYVLPWGQMSFWGLTVITSFFSAIPYVGKAAVEWLWGSWTIGNLTLNRFYSLHYLFPFLIVGSVVIHLALLHKDGSNNPIGVETKVNKIPFYPYFYVKDLFAFMVMSWVFSVLILYTPNLLGHPDNYIAAMYMKTSSHIVPEWYFLPFYSVLKGVPSKVGGIAAMISSIIVLSLLPVIHFANIRSGTFRLFYRILFFVIVAIFGLLAWVAPKQTGHAWQYPYVIHNRLFTFYYFVSFLIGIPLTGILDSFFLQKCVESKK